MTRTSPSRRHSPSMSYFDDSDVRWANRNSRDAHDAALAEAQATHEAVRQHALLILENETARAEAIKIQRLRQAEEERVRLATIRATEECRIRELQNAERRLPRPAPRIPTPPPPSPIPPPKLATPPVPVVAQEPQSQPPPQQNGVQFHQAQNGTHSRQSQGQTGPTPVSQAQQQPAPPNAQLHQTRPSITRTPVQHVPTPATRPSNPLDQMSPRYAEIHKSCKQLRKWVLEYSSDLKKDAGRLRRIVQRSVGQLTDVRGANTQITKNIMDVLREAINIPGPQVDPGIFMISAAPPNPEGAINNGHTMPALFIYLLNILAKMCMRQFIGESARNPKSADPIGVLAVSIFARDEFRWKTMSFVDIMIAKFRVNCPVLFGVRGSDKTEAGRARLGWKRENDNWVSEPEHNDRMMGLGAGFASISLRDFSKSSMTNPWPPMNYWQAVSRIVNTPSDETSATHYLVLKAMIDTYEKKILTLFGRQGIYLLKVALVDFPANAIEHTAAVSSLAVIADRLARDDGLFLRY